MSIWKKFSWLKYAPLEFWVVIVVGGALVAWLISAILR